MRAPKRHEVTDIVNSIGGCGAIGREQACLLPINHVGPHGWETDNASVDVAYQVAWREGVDDALDCLHEPGITDKADCIGRLERLLAPPGEPPAVERSTRSSCQAGSDAERLQLILSYAGSDAGRAAARGFLAEMSRLRTIETVARDVANVAMNDAGPEAFETMAALRAALKGGTT